MTIGRKACKQQLRSCRGTCGGPGTRTSSSCFGISTPRRSGPSNHNPVSVLAGFAPERFDDAGSRRHPAGPGGQRPPRAARLPRRHRGPGPRPTLRRCGYARSPISRPSSASTSRCPSTAAAWACWRATTSRARPTWGCRWWRWASSTASRTSASASTETGWQHAEYVASPAELLPAQPALDAQRASRSSSRSRWRRETLLRAGLGDRRRAQPAAAARHRRGRQLGGEPPARGAPLLRRPADPHPPGAAAGRGRRAGAAGGRHPLGRPAPQRGAQRLRHPGVHAPAHGGDRRRLPDRAPRTSRRARSSPPTRRSTPATTAFRPSWSTSTSSRCAARWGSSQHEFLGLGRIRPEDHARGAVHDGAGVQDVALRQRACRRCTGASPGKSWQVLWPHHREDEVPVGHITNGVHVRDLAGAGDAGPLQPAHRRGLARPPVGSAACGRASTACPTPSCGRPTAR